MKKNISKALICFLVVAYNSSVFAHTDSIGYTSAGSPGAMTFWYGNWHPGTTFNEGSINLAPVSGSSYPSTTVAFNLLTNTLPTGLVNGVNYFTSNGSALVALPAGYTSYTWQGATFTGLTPGVYRFTYVPIASPTANWQPEDSVILSSTFSIDAIFLSAGGPTNADTQTSLVATSSALQSRLTLQNAALINGFTYDCQVFDKNGICVSAGGRNTQVSAGSVNNTAALLIGSYRLDKNNSRIGISLDQNLTTSMPGGTIKQSNSTPMVGLFGVYQENLDNTGWEAKVGVAMGQKDTTIQRGVVGTSEPGVGSATMINQGAQATVKYGFGITEDVLVLPYAGVRYTRNNMGGYTEAASSTVTAPLTMNPVNTNSSAALIGVEGKYRVLPAVMTYASAGIERNMSTNYDNYVASSTSIAGLTPISMNPNMVRTRPTATIGAYYDIEKNQRLGVTGIYRQEMYQAVGTTTVMATYTVGL